MALGFRGPVRIRDTSTRLGLRARLIFAFALGALILSIMLAGVTYGLVRENVLRQRETAATQQAFNNARVMRDALRTARGDRSSVLQSLQIAGSRPVLYHRNEWIGIDIETGQYDLPRELRTAVISDGEVARMRYVLRGETRLAVGVPIPAVEAAYFEIVSLQEVDDTLDSLTVALLLAALVTTVAGAGIGAWASRRVLRPLAEVSGAAAAIASGHLDTRLEDLSDPDLAELVESFNHMARALEERIERDARFASDVSHELRSPLTTLSASIEVLQGRRADMPERAQAALDLLVADVQRFQSMVEDLLEISRFDAGAARLDVEPVRIGELVLHAIGTAGAGDVPIELAEDADDLVVPADKRRLVRVLANLLDNAERHAGGATRIAVDRIDGGVRIAVEDAGPGVDPEDRERVFERFSRGSAAGRRGSGGGDGVGLGLALVREHIALHGGTVRVEDRPDGQRGARFVIELPGLVA